jgi:hypothetical protein
VVVVEQDFSGGGVGLAEVAAALGDQLRAQQPIMDQDELQPLYRFGLTSDWTQLTGSMTMTGDLATFGALAGSTPQALYAYTGYTQYSRALELGITCDSNKGFTLFAFLTGSGATLCGYAADYNGSGTLALYRIDNNVWTSLGSQAVVFAAPASMAWSIRNGTHTVTLSGSTVSATDSAYTTGAVGVGQGIGNKGGQVLSGFYVQAPTF